MHKLIGSSKQSGVTLLEVMLVLAIAASLVIMGLRMYMEFAEQKDESLLASKVEQLFQGMKHYYQSNCRQVKDPTGTPLSPGLLDPNVTTSTSVALDIQNDLQKTGFLSDWLSTNVLVDASSGTDKGYYAQFIRVQPGGSDPVMNMVSCTGQGDPPSCQTRGGVILDGSGGAVRTTRVVIWLAHVAVKVLKPARVNRYKDDLGATCLASDPTQPCATSSGTGDYLVWEKMPTMLQANTTSDLWPSEINVKMFNMQYTNDMAGNYGVKGGNGYYPTDYLCGE